MIVGSNRSQFNRHLRLKGNGLLAARRNSRKQSLYSSSVSPRFPSGTPHVSNSHSGAGIRYRGRKPYQPFTNSLYGQPRILPGTMAIMLLCIRSYTSTRSLPAWIAPTRDRPGFGGRAAPGWQDSFTGHFAPTAGISNNIPGYECPRF